MGELVSGPDDAQMIADKLSRSADAKTKKKQKMKAKRIAASKGQIDSQIKTILIY